MKEQGSDCLIYRPTRGPIPMPELLQELLFKPRWHQPTSQVNCSAEARRATRSFRHDWRVLMAVHSASAISPCRSFLLLFFAFLSYSDPQSGTRAQMNGPEPHSFCPYCTHNWDGPVIYPPGCPRWSYLAVAAGKWEFVLLLTYWGTSQAPILWQKGRDSCGCGTVAVVYKSDSISLCNWAVSLWC